MVRVCASWCVLGVSEGGVVRVRSSVLLRVRCRCRPMSLPMSLPSDTILEHVAGGCRGCRLSSVTLRGRLEEMNSALATAVHFSCSGAVVCHAQRCKLSRPWSLAHTVHGFPPLCVEPCDERVDKMLDHILYYVTQAHAQTVPYIPCTKRYVVCRILYRKTVVVQCLEFTRSTLHESAGDLSDLSVWTRWPQWI